jgi:hypothetical protein
MAAKSRTLVEKRPSTIRRRPEAREVGHGIFHASLGAEGQAAIHPQKRRAAAPARQIQDVITENGARGRQHHRPRQPGRRSQEDAGQDEKNAAGERDTGRLDGTGGEHGEVDVPRQKLDERLRHLHRPTVRGPSRDRDGYRRGYSGRSASQSPGWRLRTIRYGG